MKKILRLDFSDFWPGFRKTDNFFYHLLQNRFQVEICDQPDLLIYSHQGHAHRLHTCTKVFYTDESIQPNFRECDFSLTSARLPEQPRHHRLPCYVVTGRAESLLRTASEAASILAAKKKFCLFVVSNANHKAQARIDFFHLLSKYKKVDSGGRHLNNMGGPITGGVEGKLRLLSDYKFNISFENKSLNGYTTEKLVQALQARCVPIYWGDPQVNLDFNSRSFLNLADFPSMEALVEKIIELDTNDALYLEYLSQPCFHDNQPNEAFNHEALLDFFERAAFGDHTPLAHRTPLISFGRWKWVKRNRIFPRGFDPAQT